MSWRENLHERLGDSNYRILRGIVLVFFFMVLGRLAGLLKEMVIAYRHGVSEVVDVYVFTFVVVSWIPVVFQSIGQSILVPLFRRLDPEKRRIFFSELLLVTILFGIGVCLFLFFCAGSIIQLLASGFSPETMDSATSFIRLISPSVVLLMIVTIFSAELLSREHHSNTLAEAAPALVLFVTVLAWPLDRPPLEPFAFGTLFGLVLHCLILVWISQPTLTKKLFSPDGHGGIWRELGAAMTVLGVGAIIMAVAKPLDQMVAARFGEGAVALLSYSMRTLALGIGLGMTMVSRALLPVLSDTSNSVTTRFRITRQWTLYMLVIGVLGVLAAWGVIPSLVQVVFERGAFTADNTVQVSNLVRYGLFQVPFILVGMVIVQLFTSLGEYRIVAISGIVGAIVKLVTIVPMASFLGLPGIMLSSAVMYFGTFLYLGFMYQQRRKSI